MQRFLIVESVKKEWVIQYQGQWDLESCLLVKVVVWKGSEQLLRRWGMSFGMGGGQGQGIGKENLGK